MNNLNPTILIIATIIMLICSTGISILNIIESSENKHQDNNENTSENEIKLKNKMIFKDIWNFYNRPKIIDTKIMFNIDGVKLFKQFNNRNKIYDIYNKCFVVIDNYKYEVRQIWNNGKFILYPDMNIPIIYKEHSIYKLSNNKHTKKEYFGELVDEKFIDKVIFEKYIYNTTGKITKIEVKELNVEDTLKLLK